MANADMGTIRESGRRVLQWRFRHVSVGSPVPAAGFCLVCVAWKLPQWVIIFLFAPAIETTESIVAIAEPVCKSPLASQQAVATRHVAPPTRRVPFAAGAGW